LRGHIWSLSTRAPPSTRHGTAGTWERNVTQAGNVVTVMIEGLKGHGTYAGSQFGTQPGERWRRFLERVGTRSSDFPVRLARARFVYLHRRDTGSHWLPL
jgi:hypothetical protein